MNGIAAYSENTVTTQSRGHLIVMLYDGACKFLNQAISAMEAGDVAEKGRLVGRAIEIINELDAALEMDTGGEIAANLRSLYGFMRRHVLQAHVKDDPQMLRDVISLLRDLNEAWRAISV